MRPMQLWRCSEDCGRFSRRCRGHPRRRCARTIATGSQAMDDLLHFLHLDASVSEVSAHIAAARRYYPDCRAVLDVGGQDSKAMLFDDAMQIWVSKMSGICAAGTGAFWTALQQELNVPVEQLAEHVNYDSPLQLSSVCAVLSATSVNKFKNRYPLADVIAAACRAQARTIVSGVGDLFLDYGGPIVFQGGVASNRAVAYYLQTITGNRILIPELNQVMGALGAAGIAHDSWESQGTGFSLGKRHALRMAPRHIAPRSVGSVKKSVAMRTRLTRQQFLSRGDAPLVWRNLFYPAEILNALGVRMLTMETYAACAPAMEKCCERCLTRRPARALLRKRAPSYAFWRAMIAYRSLTSWWARVNLASRGSEFLPIWCATWAASIAIISCTPRSVTMTAPWKASRPDWRRPSLTWSGRWALRWTWGG